MEDLDEVTCLGQLIEWQNQDWNQLFYLHHGIYQPSCHSVCGKELMPWWLSEMTWLKGERGSRLLQVALSKQSRADSMLPQKIACFHSRSWWSVGSTKVTTEMHWWGRVRGGWAPSFLTHFKALILTVIVRLQCSKSPLRAWLNTGLFRGEILCLFDNSIP